MTVPLFSMNLSPMGFIPRTPILCFDQHGQHLLLEAVEVGIHHVQRHLHGVEAETVAAGDLEHLQMDLGALVPGEADDSGPCPPSCASSTASIAPSGGEDAVGVRSCG